MQQTRYGLKIEVPLEYAQAVERATEALKAEGFAWSPRWRRSRL